MNNGANTTDDQGGCHKICRSHTTSSVKLVLGRLTGHYMTHVRLTVCDSGIVLQIPNDQWRGHDATDHRQGVLQPHNSSYKQRKDLVWWEERGPFVGCLEAPRPLRLQVYSNFKVHLLSVEDALHARTQNRGRYSAASH